MILIFDIGKTNKKCFVFDGDYRMVFEQSTQLPETTDEEGDPCEDVHLLTAWVLKSLKDILNDPRFQIRAINVATYGASFVHLSQTEIPENAILTPLYNYLKPFPTDLQKQFFDAYGGTEKMALETASPVLGHLNSGLQLYWIKHCKPLIFNQIKWSLHLPQYVALLMSEGLKLRGCLTRVKFRQDGQDLQDLHLKKRLNPVNPVHPVKKIYLRDNLLEPTTDITSIGCHTMLWDFRKNDYHDWVKAEGIVEKFPPIVPSQGDSATISPNAPIHTGTGLHDSSAALIPYLACFDEPFVLLSTGTWCISLNPFNPAPLTPEELAQDCLCYLTHEGKPVKAARFFGGHEHEMKVKALAMEFGVPEDFYKNIPSASTAGLAYLDFMRQLVEKQAISTRLALGNSPVRRIYVDGGFSKNETYMTLLAEAFPDMDVFSAEVAQATALGAALAIHAHWNEKPMPRNLISLKKMTPFYKG